MSGRSTIEHTAQRAGGAMGYGILLMAMKTAFAFASGIYIRRALGPELTGQLDAIRVVIEVSVGLASLGMGQVVLRFLPALGVGRDIGLIRSLLARGIGLQALGWLTCLGLVLVLRPALEAFGGTASLTGVLIVAVLLLATRLAFDTACQAYYAMLDAKFVSGVTALWQVVFLAAVVGGIGWGWGILAVIVAGAVANTVGFGVLALGARGRIRGSGDASPEPVSTGRMLNYGLPFAAVHIFKTIVWNQSETLFIRSYWSDAAAGWYGTAYQFSRMILEMVPTAIWPLVMASFAAIFEIDRARARGLTVTYYKLLFVSAVPLSVGGMILGDRAVEIIFGAEFAPAGPLTQAFFGLLMFTFLGTPLSMMFYLLERSWINLLVWLGAAIVNIGLDLLLIPHSWVWGGLIPVTVAITGMPIAYALILRHMKIRVDVPWAFLARCYLGALPLLCLIPLRGWISDTPRLLIAAVAAAALVIVGLRLVRVFRADDAGLIAFLPSTKLRGLATWMAGGAG